MTKQAAANRSMRYLALFALLGLSVPWLRAEWDYHERPPPFAESRCTERGPEWAWRDGRCHAAQALARSRRLAEWQVFVAHCHARNLDAVEMELVCRPPQEVAAIVAAARGDPAIPVGPGEAP